MITLENDYEPIVYDQPFSSHIYENQLELLQDYYIQIFLVPTRTLEQNKILNKPLKNIEVTHRNISDKLIKYKQLKKKLQIPLVLTTQRVPNYN